MKTYELTYIVSPDITSEEAEAKGKEIELAISSREGTILKQSNPAAKTFSYPIDKKASGFMGILEFQIEPERLLEVKEIVAKDGKIVRHMVIIKQAAEFKKERRTRDAAHTKPTADIEIEYKKEAEPVTEEETTPAKETAKEKVELKDIEEKLEELLGE